MPDADASTISSYQQREDAVLRAARLISCSPESDSKRELEMWTEAIADFDIRQEAWGCIEIPRALVRLLSIRHENWTSDDPR